MCNTAFRTLCVSLAFLTKCCHVISLVVLENIHVALENIARFCLFVLLLFVCVGFIFLFFDVFQDTRYMYICDSVSFRFQVPKQALGLG